MKDLKKQIGQLFIVGIRGTKLSKATKEFIEEYQPGGFILFESNIKDRKQVKALIKELKSLCDIKPFISIDQEGGPVDRLRKIGTSVPSIWGLNTLGIKEVLEGQKLLIDDLSDLGFNMNFSPVVDINSNPANPIIGTRAPGKSPEEVTSCGVKIADLYIKNNLVPVIKHFPGHGDLQIDSHLNMPVLNKSKKELLKCELAPFVKAIEKNVPAIMVSHIQLPKIEDDWDRPATVSKKSIKRLLINELGFKGLVISDDMTMKGITKNFKHPTNIEEAISAGCDLVIIASASAVEKENYELFAAKAFNYINEESKKNGKLRVRIKESYEKIISQKKKLLKDKKKDTFSLVKNNKAAYNLGKRVVHQFKKDIFFKTISKTKPMDIVFPQTHRIRKEDIKKILKEFNIKNANLLTYTMSPKNTEIDELVKSTIKVDKTILLTSDIAYWKKQITLANKLYGANPNLIVISVGLDHDIELIPNIKNYIGAYAPNYVSLYCAFEKLFK